MNTFRNKIGFLSSNALKIIAMILMLVDHVGYILYPNIEVLRIIGRLSFPIFAFHIAEGCRYTRNKLRYFLLIFILAIIFQLVLYFFLDETYMGIFVTFSISILATYALMFVKKTIFEKGFYVYHVILSIILFIGVIAGAYFLNLYFTIDYGFFGCISPTIISLFSFTFIDKSKARNVNVVNKLYKLDCLLLKILTLSIALVLIWAFSIDISLKHVQLYSLLSIPILLLYNGKRGKYRLKILFYVFYPVHLVILNFIANYLM